MIGPDDTEPQDYYYDVYNNTIISGFGHSIIKSKPLRPRTTIHHISPTTPGKKSQEVNVLKIQLGLKCNYSCSYCLQSSEIKDEAISGLDDTKKFLDSLDTWLKSDPKRVEFWGGEPFVYWAKLKILVPILRARLPKSEFLIITNGSLLDDEKVDFINEHDIMIGISHDGPQQKFRGPDPFNDDKVLASIRRLIELRPGKVSFNIVLHSKNYDLNGIYEWFEARFPNPNLSLEGVVAVYDEYTLKNIGQFTKKQYEELVDNIFMELVVHKNRFSSLTMKMESFINSLNRAPPASRATIKSDLIYQMGQKCGMDREDYLAVDLTGNVMTCQNTGSKGKHHIGHVSDFEKIKLDTSTHFIHREECMHCPVLQLCKGSCMYLYEDHFSQSCWNEYYFNMGILKAALFHLTGKVLVGIEGDIRRPEYSASIFEKFPQLKELYQ